MIRGLPAFGPCQSSRSAVLAKRIAALGTRMSVDEILKCDIQVKAIEQYFPVVLFIMLSQGGSNV